MSAVPVQWFCGAPGVGKSTVAWALYQRLSSACGCVAYVDIDQLGMVLPVPDGDPDRHQLKADALTMVMTRTDAVGAVALVVSGVLDAVRGGDVARSTRPSRSAD